MKGLIKFMTSTSGKAARIVIGLVLIGWGVYFATNTPNWILIIIGLIPLSAGTFNFCILAPFFGYSLNGTEARRQIETDKN
jgi:F0F1-type ATP synthase assembly protein I